MTMTGELKKKLRRRCHASSVPLPSSLSSSLWPKKNRTPSLSPSASLQRCVYLALDVALEKSLFELVGVCGGERELFVCLCLQRAKQQSDGKHHRESDGGGCCCCCCCWRVGAVPGHFELCVDTHKKGVCSTFLSFFFSPPPLSSFLCLVVFNVRF